MKFRFLSKTIEPQRFRYNPMYYDERKERIERKKKEFNEAELNAMNKDQRREMLKANMRETWSRGEYRQSQNRSANFRVLLLVGIILALGYFVFYGMEEIDTIVEYIF